MRYFESKAEKVGVASPGPVQAVVAHDPDSLWAIPHVSTGLDKYTSHCLSFKIKDDQLIATVLTTQEG